MKQVRVSTRAQWRAWLAGNHDREPSGIWLVFHKHQPDRQSLSYEEAVEEALSFGWIDSIIKRIDDQTYCRKFTPRKDNSRWSTLNKRRVEKVIREGQMTDFGLVKIEAAKRLGHWESEARPRLDLQVPQELTRALAGRPKAKEFFESLAPSCRRQYIGWIITAKRTETRAKRLTETLSMLEKGRKLGLK